MVFKSALRTVNEPSRCEYLKYWLGKEGLPLTERWEKSGKIPTATEDDTGNKLQTYYDLLEEEFMPTVNKMLCVMRPWSKESHQNQIPLNDWTTKVYNLVEVCKCRVDSKEKIIRNVLVLGCDSAKDKDKFLREVGDPDLARITDILKIEESIEMSVKNGNSNTASVHYACYDKRKSKGSKHISTKATNEKTCFRCGKHFEKGYMKECPCKRCRM